MFDWDEINFAECAREMIVTGDYANVQINFQPFWEKPPFFIWVQAFSMNIFGVNEFAARLPNAVCGIFTIVTLYLIGAKLFSKKFGLLWALVHAGTLLPSLYFKSGVIDPWFNYLIFISLVLFIAANHTDFNKKQWLYMALSGVILGVAVLTKGPAALLIVAICIFTFLILTKNLAFLFKPLFLFYVFTTLISSASWFILEYLSGNQAIIEQFIAYQIRLFETEDSGHSGPFFYHFLVLLLGCFPTSIIFIMGYKNQNNTTLIQSHTRLIILILFWVVLLLFSIVKTKIVHYSSLCYFPISFIATYGIVNTQIHQRFKRYYKILFVTIAIIFAILFLSIRQINSIKHILFKNNLINDEFAKLNLQAELIWLGYEWLIPLIFATGMFFLYKGLSTNNLKKLIFGFCLNIIFIVSAINTFVPKVELITQHAAIAFYKEIAKHDCYIETSQFKSFAYIFYSERKPEHHKNKSLNEFINYFYSEQKDKEFKINFYATAYSYWIKTKEVDKPAYLVAKTPEEAEFKNYPGVKKLYEKNGYSFFVKMPATAK